MSTTLGSKSVGSIVTLKENGSPVNYIVVHQGKPSSMYDDSCNGTWLLRQDLAEKRQWDGGNSNVLESSDIHSYLNNTWINRYDTDIRNAIKQVKIPYRKNGGSGGTDCTGSSGLSCRIFLLSGREVGWDSSEHSYGAALPNDGYQLGYFLNGTDSSANNKRIAKINGNATDWFTRSPNTDDTYNDYDVWYVKSNGNCGRNNANSTYGVRPALILPTTLYVLDDGSISINVPPSAPTSITVPTPSNGAQIAITWGAATDSDGTIANYKLERSVNASGWTQIFSGNTLTYTDTVGDWGLVAYRVCAVDNYGASGNYVTSETFTVQNGVFYISGPAPGMGVKSEPFDFIFTTGITGDTQSASGIVGTILLDGYEILTIYTNTGVNTTAKIDTRTISGGDHTITVKADKEDYISAVEQYTFTTPEIVFPDGGKAEQLQDSNGTPVFPQTTAALVQGLKGNSIAGNIEELFAYAKIELLVTAPAGSTVTATNGEITLKSVLATNGLCSFIIPQYGEWTVSATLGDQNTSDSVTVDTVKQYELTLSYTSATIAVTTEDGASVTCVKGDDTQTQIATGGTTVFVVTSTGEYTITATSGSKQRSGTVTISSNTDSKSINLGFALSSYSPAEIAAIADTGNAADYFEIGDTIDIVLNGIGTMRMEIADFNHDYLSGSTSASKAGITFITKDLLYQEYQMNSAETNVGGFPDSELYDMLSSTIWNAIPAEWRNVIKTVYKWYGTGNATNNGKWFGSKIWVPLEYEMLGITYTAPATEHSTGNARKYPIFTNNNSRIKKMNNGAGSANWYWTASPGAGSAKTFCDVYIDGNGNGRDSARNNYGVCFGFCV